MLTLLLMRGAMIYLLTLATLSLLTMPRHYVATIADAAAAALIAYATHAAAPPLLLRLPPSLPMPPGYAVFACYAMLTAMLLAAMLASACHYSRR